MPASGLPSRADYTAMLVRTYGYVAPLESACRYTPGLDRMFETRALTRTGLLVQDLLTLGLSASHIARLPQCEWITTFRSAPEALGWLYVLHRWAGVVRLVRDRIAEHEPRIADASTYIDAIGEHAESWIALTRTLDRVGCDVADDIVAAAQDAFAALARWTPSDESWMKTG